MSRSVISEFSDRGRLYCGYDDSEQEWLATGRYRFALNFINEGDTCLDAACGSGYGSELISRKAKEVIALDVDEHALSFAESHHRNGKISFHKADLTQPLALPDACCEVIVSVETIEHIVDHDAFLREFRRVLKPGGRLILTTVDHEVYSERGGIRNKFHVGELTKKELHALISRYFTLEETYGQIRHVPLSWRKRLSQKVWLSFISVVGVLDVLRLRRRVLKRFRLNSAVDAVNRGLSPMKITAIEKTDVCDTNDYYQLIVVARKV